MDNHFGGVIWTNHALDRLRERGIKQGDAWATWNRPESSRKGTTPGTFVYFRNYGATQIEVVAKKNEKGKWLILSVWSRPVPVNNNEGVQGTKTSFWKFIVGKLFH
jgi:hypothetical protein